MIRRLLIAALALFAAGAARAQPLVQDAPAAGPHVRFDLVAAQAGVAPGSTVWLGLRQTITPGWHTYWKNAGDAGQPPQVAWSTPKGYATGPLTWPTPRRQRESTLVTYGYEGQVWLLAALTAPRSARPGEVTHISAHVDVLVCKDLCVPESAEVALDLPVVSGAPATDPRFASSIAAALASAPRPLGAGDSARAALTPAGLKLAFSGPGLARLDPTGAWFFAADPGVIAYAAPETIERGSQGFTFTLKANPVLARAGLSAPVAGVLALRSGAAFEVSAQPGTLPANASGAGAAPAADALEAARAKGQGGVGGLMTAILFGLLGGVILNLMPCVFPVLSIKAAALSQNGHDPAAARRDGVGFLAGVMVAFLGLALALLAAKAAGEAVGWGFQLQSPGVTAFLTLLTLGVALNLSGVFEAGLSLQGVGADLQRRPGAAGAFFTGVLAVMVGAPCSAPVMATAVGYAIAAGPLETVCVFLALGVGLAAPFVALSLTPKLLARLPRPGPWMEAFRRLLAFPMYATAAFMAWVFAQQSGQGALGWLLAGAVALSLSLHLWGRAQAQGAQGLRTLVGLAFAGLAFAVAVFAGVWGVIGAGAGFAVGSPAAAQPGVTAEGGDLHAAPWSQARVEAARAEGRPVFVNFTAAWCVTCKVNEGLTFADPAVRRAFAATRTVYLVGDWTRRDDAITQALAAQGRAGVPLYLVYRPGAATPEVLAQVLTPQMVKRALGAG